MVDLLTDFEFEFAEADAAFRAAALDWVLGRRRVPEAYELLMALTHLRGVLRRWECLGLAPHSDRAGELAAVLRRLTVSRRDHLWAELDRAGDEVIEALQTNHSAAPDDRGAGTGGQGWGHGAPSPPPTSQGD